MKIDERIKTFLAGKKSNYPYTYKNLQDIVDMFYEDFSSRQIASILFDSPKLKSSINDIINGLGLREIKAQEAPKKPRGDVIDKGWAIGLGETKTLAEAVVEACIGIHIKTTPLSEYVHNKGGNHLVIPDTQVKEGVDLSHLEAAGKMIVEKLPDVIIQIGDHADLESLSSYDTGTKRAEGKRVHIDIAVAKKGMEILLAPLYEYQKTHPEYKPVMILTLGNHEDRINRHVNANPHLEGFLSTDSLGYKEFGWEVFDFLQPVVVDGVTYCHFMANPFSGKPYGGSALNILTKVGESFTVGHKQCLDIATRCLPSSGRQQWGIVAGSFYLHNEDYKGWQGNHHPRCLIYKEGVKDGSYSPTFLDIHLLKSLYGE